MKDFSILVKTKRYLLSLEKTTLIILALSFLFR